MPALEPPYFFDEFLLPVKRDQPSARERALGLTVKDLDWMHTLYYATDSARQNTRLRGDAMQVDKFFVTADSTFSAPLAGIFMMSPSPDASKAVLYTPYGGLEVFESRQSAIDTLEGRLKTPASLQELTRFLSIPSRKTLFAGKILKVSTATIDGAVLEDQEKTLQASLQENMRAMLDELRKIPILEGMLDTLLAIMARSYFPGLNQRDTRMNSYLSGNDPIGDNLPQWIASVPLSSALLQFYVEQEWPAGQVRTFSNPRHVTSGFSPQQLEQDRQRWQSLVQQTAEVLSKLLGSLLKTYWNEDCGYGGSRLDFFAQAMSDKFRTDLLLKRQAGILSTAESLRLQALFLPDHPERPATPGDLHIEKVRIHAPYQHTVELAGTLMSNATHAYLYTQPRGLQVLKDLDDLKDTLLSMLKTAGYEDELLNFLSMEERDIFIGLGEVQITGEPVSGNVFTELAQDILAKQLSNMDHALAIYRRSDGRVDPGALFDCALDVRSLFDPRLLSLDAGGRWSLNPVSGTGGLPTTVKSERAKRELPRLRAIDAALVAEQQLSPDLRGLVEEALNTELQRHKLDLSAGGVNINTYPDTALEREQREPSHSVSMPEHFIQRLVSETGPVPDSSRIWFYGPRQQGAVYKLHNLTLAMFNTIIEKVMATFADSYIRESHQRLLDSRQTNQSQGLLQGLRSEAMLRQLGRSLSRRSFDMLETVLEGDSQTRLTRHALNGFLPDAFSLTIKSGIKKILRPLANAFVLTERGGTDPLHSGSALLWTPHRGYESFLSVKHLYDALAQRLRHPHWRFDLLENLPDSSLAPHQVHEPGPLLRIDGHFLNDRQRSWRDLILDNINYRLRIGLGAEALQRSLDELMKRLAPSNLHRAMRIAQSFVHQQALPIWLGMASADEQRLHAELLEQYRLSAADEKDYLHDIQPLREYVYGALEALLKARFAGAFDNPDDVLIPTRLTLENHVQTLTDFALRYHVNLVADHLRPYSRTSTPLPAALDGSAVVQMVRQLDLKKVYRDWIDTHLGESSAGALERRRLFCRLLPWQVLHRAHEDHLEERLSAQAWSFIQQIFDMPDDIARNAVSGVTAMICPLVLVATAGAEQARANGIYLIGPQPDEPGPLVLYTPYREGRVLQEFARQEDLLRELDRPGDLRDWVIEHLESAQQAVYRNLWSAPAQDREIRLATSAITGNVLTRLFTDNRAQIKHMLGYQFHPSGKSLWDTATSLLHGGIPLAERFLGGKLMFPLTVWRSHKLFKASAEDLQQRRWSHAIRAFARGVAQLASLRKELDTLLGPDNAQENQVSVQDWLNTPVTAITLATLDVTEPQRTRLNVFEPSEVALRDLEKSPLTHTYKSATGTTAYVPVAGKVYEVKRAGDRWRLHCRELDGPYVQHDAQGNWVLDLNRHDPRYGKTLSRIVGRTVTRMAERQIINLEAIGMREIRAVSSWKAQCINEALNVATYYTVTCKRNLILFARQRDPLSRLGRFFTEFFGIHRMTPEQLARIESQVDQMLDELTNPSITRADSDRFVCGSSRWMSAETYAFTIPHDPEKKIYLVDRFFDPMMDVYQNRLTTPFDITAHARAATLIHELTHLVCDAEDIAYVDSMRPFHDLINVNVLGAHVLKTDLADVRTTALSTLTPATMLFKSWDDYSQTWLDLGHRRNTRPIKNKILQITGAKTLDDARQTFMSDEDKRMDIIMANADSLSYMITQLGRELDAGA